jgi:hypothetical protein
MHEGLEKEMIGYYFKRITSERTGSLLILNILKEILFIP